MIRMDIWDMVDKILDRLGKLEQLTDNLAMEMIQQKREDKNNCSLLTCPFNLKITQLFNRIEKLENDMKLCKEHYDKLLEDRG